MKRKVLRTLKDRPILSIIICVVLSEVIQLVITLVSDKPPAFHYGIAVMALLALFVTPVILQIQDKRNRKEIEQEPDNESDDSKDAEKQTQDDSVNET